MRFASREEEKEYWRKYYIKNKANILIVKKKYRHSKAGKAALKKTIEKYRNSGKLKKAQKKYYEKNKKEINKKKSAYHKAYYKKYYKKNKEKYKERKKEYVSPQRYCKKCGCKIDFFQHYCPKCRIERDKEIRKKCYDKTRKPEQRLCKICGVKVGPRKCYCQACKQKKYEEYKFRNNKGKNRKLTIPYKEMTTKQRKEYDHEIYLKNYTPMKKVNKYSDKPIAEMTNKERFEYNQKAYKRRQKRIKYQKNKSEKTEMQVIGIPIEKVERDFSLSKWNRKYVPREYQYITGPVATLIQCLQVTADLDIKNEQFAEEFVIKGLIAKINGFYIITVEGVKVLNEIGFVIRNSD